MIKKFSKMHGLGNDFIVIDATTEKFDWSSERIKQLADRHTGIGFDQLLLIQTSQVSGLDFRYRIFNADGSEVEHCGNGARCVALYLRQKGLSDKNIIPLEMARGRIELELKDANQVNVDMAVPQFEPTKLPFQSNTQQLNYTLSLANQDVTVGVVSMGNPHAVTLVNDIDTAEVQTLGPQIESHPRFPNRVNAGFMQIIDRTTIRLRVYERGAGETQACGTGACAAVAIGRLWGLLDDQVVVHLARGTLTIAWQGQEQPLYMCGPASHVYDGVLID